MKVPQDVDISQTERELTSPPSPKRSRPECRVMNDYSGLSSALTELKSWKAALQNGQNVSPVQTWDATEAPHQMMLPTTTAWTCVKVIRWFLGLLSVVTESRKCLLADTCAGKHLLQRNTEEHLSSPGD
ncbi:uncharacterized protein LOC102076202 isoform X2 [Oreochromis niloticus]|uniref:uncharacterized protein LOC102076202 isoform X2 n=1 Tax=Oreochromis niloticus TaxID=8128 RepID=UPI000674871D|nr:uncharacterized protein LOC102076202 isoform X2 [Oreochromis niloticus]